MEYAGQNFDSTKLKTVIENVLDRNHADLQASVAGAIEDFCSKMFQKSKVSATVRDSKDFTRVIHDYKTKMLFMRSLNEFRKHCQCLIIVLKAVGGPATDAAEALQREWEQQAVDELDFSFILFQTPQQNDTYVYNDPRKFMHRQRHVYSQGQLVGIESPSTKSVHTNPPIIPNSSTDIWQCMKHDRHFRKKILGKVQENIVAPNRDESQETLSTIWKHQVENDRQKVQLSPALNIEDFPYAYKDFQESGERKRSLWITNEHQAHHESVEYPLFSDPSPFNRSDTTYTRSAEQPPSSFESEDEDCTPLQTTSCNPLSGQVDSNEQQQSGKISTEVSAMADLNNSLQNEINTLKQRVSKIENEVKNEIRNMQRSEKRLSHHEIKQTNSADTEGLKERIATLQAKLDEKQIQVRDYRVMLMFMFLVIVTIIVFLLCSILLKPNV